MLLLILQHISLLGCTASIGSIPDSWSIPGSPEEFIWSGRQKKSSVWNCAISSYKISHSSPEKGAMPASSRKRVGGKQTLTILFEPPTFLILLLNSKVNLEKNFKYKKCILPMLPEMKKIFQTLLLIPESIKSMNHTALLHFALQKSQKVILPSGGVHQLSPHSPPLNNFHCSVLTAMASSVIWELRDEKSITMKGLSVLMTQGSAGKS